MQPPKCDLINTPAERDISSQIVRSDVAKLTNMIQGFLFTVHVVRLSNFHLAFLKRKYVFVFPFISFYSETPFNSTVQG